MIAVLLALTCGVEAWPQKVLTDPGAGRALRPAPMATTIAQIGALPRTARRRAYSVEGQVQAVKREADGDLHVIIAHGDFWMIVELPNPACVPAESKAIAAIRRAWLQAADLRVGQRVRAVGMLFFDRLHGQSGAAPNGAELHPLFSIRRLR
jgi:hypothetical protein